MISHHNVIKMILLSRNVLLSHSWTALIFRCVVIAPRTLEKRGEDQHRCLHHHRAHHGLELGRMVIASLAFKQKYRVIF